MTSVAILSSRQSKTPVGSDPWVQATLAAISHAAANGWSIISSIGINTWELVTWAAGQSQVPLLLVVPSDTTSEARESILNSFRLCRDQVSWLNAGRSEARSTRKNWWEDRDALVIRHADILLPVSVREKGRINSLMHSANRKFVENQFQIRYRTASHHARASIRREQLSADVTNWADGWLIHWTRSSHGPWPGETSAEFYSSMVESRDAYCRDALATLSRIVVERQLRGSAWKTAAGSTVVAFTELSPSESINLMRWRPRWGRWSFEPYGIAIRKLRAVESGARPVKYVDAAEWRSVPVEDRPFAHGKGAGSEYWPTEREWRVVGNVALRDFDPSDVCVIVRDPSEIDHIRRLTESPIVSMT